MNEALLLIGTPYRGCNKFILKKNVIGPLMCVGMMGLVSVRPVCINTMIAIHDLCLAGVERNGFRRAGQAFQRTRLLRFSLLLA